MDMVLKLYDGSTNYHGRNPAASLDNTIHGGLLDYYLQDNSNYQVDRFESTIRNRGESISALDVWRLFALDTSLQSSGRIMTPPQAFGDRKLRMLGEDWTSILKDRMVRGESYDAQGGDDIVKDILTNYFDVANSDYNINVAEVAATTNSITKEFDGISAYDVVKDVAAMSYGGNSREFDFYIYEQTATLGTLRFKFFERQPASSLTINQSMVRPGGFSLFKRKDLDFNVVNVYGAIQNFNHCPLNQDWWTENNSGFFFATNATHSTEAFLVKFGSFSDQWSLDASVGIAGGGIRFDDVDAFDSIQTPTEVFTSGSGYIIDLSKNQFISFDLRIDGSLADELAAGGDAKVLLLELETDSTATTGLDFNIFSNEEFTSSGLFGTPQTGNRFWRVEIPIKDLVDSDAVYVSDMTLLVDYDQGNEASNDDFYLDHLNFFEKTGQCFGTFPSSPSVAPIREFPYYDREIKHDSLANDIAEFIHTTFYEQFNGTFLMRRPNNTIRAGDTITLNYGSEGITGQALNIQTIERMPHMQILHPGRKISRREIDLNIRRMIRRK